MWVFSEKKKKKIILRKYQRLIPVAACLLRILVRIPPGACLSVLSAVCCQVEVSAMG
jgi:hypothetical protein